MALRCRKPNGRFTKCRRGSPLAGGLRYKDDVLRWQDFGAVLIAQGTSGNYAVAPCHAGKGWYADFTPLGSKGGNILLGAGGKRVSTRECVTARRAMAMAEAHARRG
jgi:hypothetical protein